MFAIIFSPSAVHAKKVLTKFRIILAQGD